jgi:D-threo-aldose 1-dehydrogenase
MTGSSSKEWIREIGNTGIRTSAIIAGASPLGSMRGLYGYEVDRDDAIDLVRQLLNSPVRAIDTSNNYSDGESERRIGAAIAAEGGLPDDFTVITKVDALDGDFSGGRVRRSLDESQERLGLGTLPLLFLHDPEGFDFDTIAQPGGAVDTLVTLKEEGRVGHIGIAAGDVHVVSRYIELGVFDVLLSHNRWTLVDRSADTLFDQASSAGMGVLNAAIYGGGVLADPTGSSNYGYRQAPRQTLDAVAAMNQVCRAHGTDLATAALQFSIRDPRVHATVVGFTKPSRIATLTASAGAELPEELWTALAALVPSKDNWLDFRPAG